jgi:hypothetical protein
MPAAKTTKKTFTKKKVEEPKPKKVIKKVVSKPQSVEPEIAEVLATPTSVKPSEKKVSWLPEKNVETAQEEAQSPAQPTLSEMPVPPSPEGEPAAPTIAASVTPDTETSQPAEAANDSWPNPATLAHPDTTTFSNPQEAQPVAPETPEIQAPVEVQPAVTEPVAEAEDMPTNDSQKTVPSNAVLGPNFDGGRQGGKKKLLLLFIIVFLFVGLLTSGFFYYLSTQKGSLPGFAQAPTPTPTTVPPTPTPTITEEENLSDYTIEVLNGSGTAGEAGRVSALLEEAGFEGIDTGNADAYDYTNTEVQIGKDVPATVYTQIEKALKDNYSVVKSKDAPNDEYDVTIIVGSSDAVSIEDEE